MWLKDNFYLVLVLSLQVHSLSYGSTFIIYECLSAIGWLDRLKCQRLSPVGTFGTSLHLF